MVDFDLISYYEFITKGGVGGEEVDGDNEDEDAWNEDEEAEEQGVVKQNNIEEEERNSGFVITYEAWLLCMEKMEKSIWIRLTVLIKILALLRNDCWVHIIRGFEFFRVI